MNMQRDKRIPFGGLGQVVVTLIRFKEKLDWQGVLGVIVLGF